ncbi:MAG: DUF1203 domain-containing protein [Salinicola sp.]|uniref:DUF1203 domain-containing protein n=1 Tax=Salinicola sp. TaxID=1978524 RepID=UPI001DE2D6D2|nr:DUF1203 domain-containing protein [Salinicola sp.]NRB54614.1 DUF1203 domain-containing protein [Salinicola sp.]
MFTARAVPPTLFEWRHILGGRRQLRQAATWNIEEWRYSRECRMWPVGTFRLAHAPLFIAIEGNIMSFRCIGLFIDINDVRALSRKGLASRVVAGHGDDLPCRFALTDVAINEAAWLLHYTHHDVETPYRASGPVFIGEAALLQKWTSGVVPPSLLKRSLSIRAYDAHGWLTAAALSQGADLVQEIERLWSETRTDYLHIHYAATGCYACRVERA